MRIHGKIAALALLVLTVSACGDVDATAAARGPLSGEELYTLWCADCHNPGPGHPGTLRLQARLEADEAVLLHRANDPEAVRFVVRNGLQMMPPFRTTEISDEELQLIVDYLAEPRQ